MTNIKQSWLNFKKIFFYEDGRFDYSVIVDWLLFVIIYVFLFSFCIFNLTRIQNSIFSEREEMYYKELISNMWENGVDSIEYERIELEETSEEADTRAIYTNSFDTPECKDVKVIIEFDNIKIRRIGNIVAVEKTDRISVTMKLDFSSDDVKLEYNCDDFNLLKYMCFWILIFVATLVRDFILNAFYNVKNMIFSRKKN